MKTKFITTMRKYFLYRSFRLSITENFANYSTFINTDVKLTDQGNLYDIAIIGGGIIGTSIGRKITMMFPKLKTVILEKESSISKHQTSHNSGVLHCGAYYRPGSLKAKFCVEGLELLKKYCREKSIAVKHSGKLIVANTECELRNLNSLYERGKQNNVPNIQYLCSTVEVRKKVPSSRGIEAIWIPNSSNVDFKSINKCLTQDFLNKNGQIYYNFEVAKIGASDNCDHPIQLISNEEKCVTTKYLIMCGGLQSENLTKLVQECPPKEKTISLNVKYKLLKKKCEDLHCNIYAVPDLDVPFLGPHVSPTLTDDVLLGPWTFPALKTEGYSNEELNFVYLRNLATSCAFRNMVVKNFGKCLDQVTKSLFSNFQVRDIQKLAPEIPYQDIQSGPTAVQCQMFNQDGTFVDDFVFEFFSGEGFRKNVVNCKYVPSPGATSCLAIADYVSATLSKEMC